MNSYNIMIKYLLLLIAILSIINIVLAIVYNEIPAKTFMINVDGRYKLPAINFTYGNLSCIAINHYGVWCK